MPLKLKPVYFITNSNTAYQDLINYGHHDATDMNTARDLLILD